MRKSLWSGRLPLMLIVLGGTALRLFRLGAESLWYDETVSVTLAGSPLPALVGHTAGDIHPPGYYILLRGWLWLMGYPTGRADPAGYGLELAAGFFSLFFGVALIALVYTLARRACRGCAEGRAVALVAAGLTAASPYHVWYSQEVRMYTLGAGLGALALYALLRGLTPAEPRRGFWWAAYALAAAAGMYTLYYFAFLLIALNGWVAWGLVTRGLKTRNGRPLHNFVLWLLANVGAAALYAPWMPVAYQQATQPPVPPWRTAPALLGSLGESWSALVLGQAAPAWGWSALIIAAALYGLGLLALTRAHGHPVAGSLTAADPPSRHAEGAAPPAPALALALATFGALALILLVSLVTPLYHVRYLFTYSPAFYAPPAAGLVWLWTRRPQRSWRMAAVACVVLWLIAAGGSLRAFWTSPAYRADDLRGAVRFLQARWRPGDALVVNAGWTYTALQTYWNGPIAVRARLTADLPTPRADAALIMLTTGHVDGAADLGWGDPRADFYAMPAAAARRQIAALWGRFIRVWHFRIYDTVNDPAGLTRTALAQDGRLFEDQPFTGEANLRVQGFLSRGAPPGGPAAPVAGQASFDDQRLLLTVAAAGGAVEAGQTVYIPLRWQAAQPLATDFAVSVRLLGPDGEIWAQPPDERPAGPQFPAHDWPTGAAVPHTLALPVPLGAAPGVYTVALVVYDPAAGQPWPAAHLTGALSAGPDATLALGRITVTRPVPAPAARPALARFGPLALAAANSPATTLSPGSAIPVNLTWQAAAAPGEPLVVVVQLLDAQGNVTAGLEAQPLAGRYPTQAWAQGEIVADRHTLAVPAGLAPGPYRLVIGVYRATDRARLPARSGLFGNSAYYVIKTIEIRP